MEDTQTLLQKIIAQKEKQIARAIEEAVENGATVEHEMGGLSYIDGILVQRPCYGQQCDAVIVLQLNSQVIKEAIADDPETLARRKDDLIKQIAEIDKQLNSSEQ